MANRVINTILNLKDNFSKGIKKVTSSTQTLQKQMKQVELQSKSMRQNVSNSFNGITTAVGLGGVASLGALAKSSVSTYATFEESMSKVQALSGATGEDLNALSEKAQLMGRSTSKSASESADALGYMALAGWDINQMLTGLEPILRASEAGQMDLATCSDLVTDSMSAMGIKVENLTDYLDVVTKAQASSNTSMQGLLEAYILCGGTMKNLGVSVEESATVLGTLANRGKKASEAGNALNSILVNLTGGSSTAKGAMKELGISAWDSKGNFIGLKNTLVKLKDALAKCTQEQKTNFESAIGGKTQMDTLQAMLSGVSEEYDTLNEKLKDSKGYMAETARVMQNNLKGALTSMKSAFEGLQIAIGKRFAPVLMKVMDWVTNSLPYWTSNITWFLDGIYYNALKCKPVVVGLATAFGLFMIVGTVSSLVNTFAKALGKINLIGMLTNPLALTAIAIGVLAGYIVHLMETNEDFRNKMVSAWEYVQSKWTEGLQNFWKWLEVIREEYGSLANFIMSKKKLIATIGGVVGALLGFKLLSPISGKINILGAAFGKTLLKILGFSNKFSGLKKVFAAITSPIKTLKTGLGIIGAGFKGLQRTLVLFKAFGPTVIVDFIKSFLTGAFSFRNIVSIFKTGIGGLVKSLLGLISPFGLIVAAIGLLVAGFIYCWTTNEEFREKMIAAWEVIKPAIVNTITFIVGAIALFVSKIVEFVIENKETIMSIITDIFTFVGDVIALIVDVIKNIVKIVTEIVDTVRNIINGDWAKVWENCKNIVSTAVDSIKEFWNDLKEVLKTPIKAFVNIFKKDKGTDTDIETVDNNATGTKYFGGGWTTVGEHGTELMKLPRGTQIKSNSESKKMMNAGNGVNVTLNINGNVIGNEEFANYVGNYIWSKVKTSYGNM